MKQLLISMLLALPACAQLTTINGSDLITNSRAVINANYSWLLQQINNPYTSSLDSGTDTASFTTTRAFTLRRGGQSTVVSSGATFSVQGPTGTGDAYVYFGGSGPGYIITSADLTWGSGTLTGITADTASSIPNCAIPIAKVTASSDNITAVTSLWQGQSAPACEVEGSNVDIAESGANKTTSVDLSGVAGGGSPGGSGTEIQYRSGASTFGAVTGSAVSGADVDFGGTVKAGANQKIEISENASRGYIKGTDDLSNVVYMMAKAGTATGEFSFSTNLADDGVSILPKGGIKLFASSAAPTCNTSNRGTLWIVQGASGASDHLDVCMKKADNSYAWLTIFTAP